MYWVFIYLNRKYQEEKCIFSLSHFHGVTSQGQWGIYSQTCFTVASDFNDITSYLQKSDTRDTQQIGPQPPLSPLAQNTQDLRTAYCTVSSVPTTSSFLSMKPLYLLVCSVALWAATLAQVWCTVIPLI